MSKPTIHPLILSAVLFGVFSANAQIPVGDGALTPIGGGMSYERQIQLKAKDGPFQVMTGEFTLPQGGALDWHDHPGTGVITVTQGIFTESKENGCVVFHNVGSVFFEEPGKVHRVENSGPGDAVGLITFFLPLGSNAIEPVGTPNPRTCPPTGKDPEEEKPSLEDVQAKIGANAEAIQKVYDLLNNLARTLPFRR